MRRLTPTLLALGLAATLAACGSGESDDPTGDSTGAETSQEDTGTDETSDEATEDESEATEEESEEATEDADAGAATDSEMVAVPADGPSGITEFPIPAGTEITDLGAFGGNWAFVVTTSDPAAVVDFYAAVLPDLGYTVSEDVQGVNVDLVFDLGFSGPTFGAIRESPLLGGVEVQLDNGPITQ